MNRPGYVPRAPLQLTELLGRIVQLLCEVSGLTNLKGSQRKVQGKKEARK